MLLPSAAQQAGLSTAVSPSSHVTTPQHSAPQPTQLVVMQGIGSGPANATSIPVGSVFMTAAPMQARAGGAHRFLAHFVTSSTH